MKILGCYNKTFELQENINEATLILEMDVPTTSSTSEETTNLAAANVPVKIPDNDTANNVRIPINLFMLCVIKILFYVVVGLHAIKIKKEGQS